MGKLTVRTVQTAKPGKHEDGDGLRLVVSNSGYRRWVLRVTVKGKRREMGLGAFPAVTLAKAREQALEARKQAQNGIDPVESRKAPTTTIPSFMDAAEKYIEIHRSGWSNAKHAAQWSATLATYAYPIIGSKSVVDITTEDILEILNPIWTDKTETAKRVQGRIENILDYASAMKWRGPINPARWRGHMDKLLPKPTKVKKVRHHPAMPYTELPAFICELANNHSVSAYALKWLILSAARTSEALGATWDEIDLEARVWTIPGERMKTKKEHRAPITEAMTEILDRLPRVEGNPHLFIGTHHGKSLSNMALLQLMRGSGYGVGGDRGDYVPHGFRSSFRDWSGEVFSFPRDVAEMALAHTIGDKVEAAYRRGDLFDKRRKMMQEWGDWCLQPADTSV